MRKTTSFLMVLVFFGLSISLLKVGSVRADSVMVRIRPDGSVDPGTAPILRAGNSEYTFTADINGSLMIERGNIIVDGAFFSLRGSGTVGSVGLNVTGSNNVTMRNLNVQAFGHAIHLSNSSGCRVLGNKLDKNIYGIWVEDSVGILVSGNEINATAFDGISLNRSSEDVVSNNNLTLTTGFGIIAVSGSSNTISENDLRDTHEDGVELIRTSNNSLIQNKVFATYFYGIELATSSNNFVSENSVQNGTGGVAAIRLHNSTENVVWGNNVTNNDVGFDFSYHSSNNNVAGNTIENSRFFGMTFSLSPGNVFFHNNFLNNAQHVSTSGVTNTWDDGYPSGGNYWSDYVGSDIQSGIGQNISGSDGIGDTPYVIFGVNQDHYPLMSPYVVREFSSSILIPALVLITSSAGIALRRKVMQLRLTMAKR